jgi:DNA polymerase III sliding clamp (beta) subunit (PCNA family)
LTCVHVSESGIVEASDGNRITQCQLKDEMPVKDFLIPAGSVVSMIKLKPTKISLGEGWVHFQTEESTVISCRIFEEKYPNTSPHLKVEGVQLILPQSIDEVLDRAAVFAKRDHVLDESLQITIKNKRLTIRADSDTGWFEEEINMRYDGDPISFFITPYLLKGILAETSACILSEKRIKFEGQDWQYIAVLKHNV